MTDFKGYPETAQVFRQLGDTLSKSQPVQLASYTEQQQRYRLALVREQVGRLQLAGETRAAQLLREWYLEDSE